MKKSALNTLGDQIISNEVAIISMLQALTQVRPAIGNALVQAMRENYSRVPSNLCGARERIGQYLELLEKLLSAQAPEPVARVATVKPLRRQA